MTTTLSQVSQIRANTAMGAVVPAEVPRSTSVFESVRVAVREVDDSELRRVARAEAGPGYEPRMMLAILTYCYAKEIYGSADVEDMLRRDRRYRDFCQNEFPGPRLFRKFRRENREVLQHTLERVLQVVWPAYPVALPAPEESPTALEASRRLTKAMFIDSMEDWD